MSDELLLPLEDDPKCAECRLPIEEGSVLAFGNHIWHVECFRCCKCGTVVDHDSNLLLLNDGMPICENCSYNCRVCHKKIDDLAIMTGDESYHSECFRCRMCQRKIEDLVFAKTSQGIYCISCHNGRMAKNRKSKSGRADSQSTKDLKEKILPSVPSTQSASSDDSKKAVRPFPSSPGHGLSNQDSTFSPPYAHSLHSGETSLPSPSRRPPAPPSMASYAAELSKHGVHNDFKSDMQDRTVAPGENMNVIPIQLQESEADSEAAPTASKLQQEPSIPRARGDTTGLALDVNGHKGSVRERRRPTDAELRLPTSASPMAGLSPSNGRKDTPERDPQSSTYSLFPPRSGNGPRATPLATPVSERGKGFILSEASSSSTSKPRGDPSAALAEDLDRSPNSGAVVQRGVPDVPTSTSPLAQSRDLGRRDAPLTTLWPAAEIDSPASGRAGQSHSRNVSFSEQSAEPPRTAQSANQITVNDISSPRAPRHYTSKSLEHSPAYVSSFEHDLSRAFNLSPRAKRESQSSLNGTLERSGTISRLAGKMLKHKKSVSGSALTPKSPGPDRRKSTPEGSDISILQAEIQIKSERIAYLEKSLERVADAQKLEKELEARKSLLAHVENQLVQSGAEHQSYLHHRHRISDVSIPLGEWKANVLADMDTTLKKTRDHLSKEIEQLLRERNDLRQENEKLDAQKVNLLQDVFVLESRHVNLTEMHESMLKQIQGNMEANKESKTPMQSVTDPRETRPDTTTSLQSDCDPKALSTTSSSNDLTLSINANHKKEPQINEEDEDPMVESAFKRMSGERIPDMAAPKKFNLVKKTKKAFRWGRGPAMQDPAVSAYSISGPANLTLSERTMSSSKSSDKLSTKSNSNAMFKRTWQSQQNLSSYLDNKSDVNDVTSTSTLFGNDLSKQAQLEGRMIPQIVTSCIKTIEARALDFEGIYRKSGGAGEMKSLIEAFEIANTEGDTINVPGFLDISAITSVLKQYLRKLPVPLITHDCYEPFIGTSAIPNTHVRIRAVKEVLYDLPESHQETLRAVLKHLNLVSQHSATNLMTSKNLAVVLGPSIIWDQAGDKEISDMHDKNSCIQFCIEYADQI